MTAGLKSGLFRELFRGVFLNSSCIRTKYYFNVFEFFESDNRVREKKSLI